MEDMLRQLFDYQHFEQNSKLGAVISESKARYESALTDDELDCVSAAGDFTWLKEESVDTTAYYGIENPNSGK